MKVLIIKLSSLGDVVHTLPAMAALRKGLAKRHGSVLIDWLVEEAASGILKGNSLVDNVIVVKRGWFRNLKANLEVSRRLKNERYDMVLDFQGLLKSGVWVYMSGAQRKIGFSNARELSGIFLNEKAPPYDPDRHAVDRYIDLAVYAGGITPFGGVEYPLREAGAGSAASVLEADAQAKKRVFEKLTKAGLPSGGIAPKGGITPFAGFFVIAPGARWKTKLWKNDRFVEAGKKTVETSSLYAVLVGGAADRNACEGIKSGIGNRAINMAGETDLKELAEMMRASRFVLTVDSGPMHIASAVGADVIALFGPTAPGRTGPYGKGAVVIRSGLPCSPCFKKTCVDTRCMDGITSEEVLDAVNMVLARKKAPSAGGAA